MRLSNYKDHFGYPVDPSDPKFVALMEKKRLEERKAAKAAKKRALEEKMIAHLQSSATSIAEGTSGP
ncbi:hypothetical protein D918_02151 [Trichuris suis]|nr:hypothetical protein D918_02151 [Trichuris suis]